MEWESISQADFVGPLSDGGRAVKLSVALNSTKPMTVNTFQPANSFTIRMECDTNSRSQQRQATH